MYSKSLEGAMVVRVYYTSVVPTWLPGVGDGYETFSEAKQATLDALNAKDSIANGRV